MLKVLTGFMDSWYVCTYICMDPSGVVLQLVYVHLNHGYMVGINIDTPKRK